MCRLCFVPMFLALVMSRVAAADEQAEAKAILEQVIKANGGEATLSKFVAMHCKMASSTEFMGEFWLRKLAKCVI